METLEPAFYEPHGHGAVVPRRLMSSGYGPNLSFYGNPTTSYAFHFQPQSPSYSFSHPGPCQHYLLAAPQQMSLQPVRAELPVQSITDIRPAKNALSRSTKLPSTKLKVASTTQLLPAYSSSSGSSSSSEAGFSTEVDVLMKAIQSRLSTQFQTSMDQVVSRDDNCHNFSAGHNTSLRNETSHSAPIQSATLRSSKRRKYTCTLPECGKGFAQRTHLDIHMRAHTGDKPFVCKEPLCGQRFSQLGNLKTHQRRHTGEKPFSCDICQKRFAQRGNVRAHRITHENTKPFRCLLDNCGKRFTQLGNLKSHQNKFHSATLRNLTMKFRQIADTETMDPQDRELFEHFASLYKNSNKGIKGRGKDRRIVSSPSISSATSQSAADLLDSRSAEDNAKAQRAVYEEDLSTYPRNVCSDENDTNMNGYYIGQRG